MKTIKERVENEIVIKNSRFITLLLKLNHSEEVNFYLEEAKKNYPKATHYCYCYRIGDFQKFSDDKEPGGTAGLPMLHVLEKENITSILAITIRYFGGIKLGAGGLVRAYTKSLTKALEKAEIINLVSGYLVQIEIPYEEEKELIYLLKHCLIIKKDYQETVIYQVEIPQSFIDKISKYSYQIIKEIQVIST